MSPAPCRVTAEMNEPQAIPLQDVCALTGVVMPVRQLGRQQLTSDGRKCNQILATLAVSLFVVSAGSTMVWPLYAMPQLLAQNQLVLSKEDGYRIRVMASLGAVVGAMASGCLADKFGRKIIVSATSAVFLMTWILTSTANSVGLLYTARFVAGLPTGVVLVVVPVYVGEVADRTTRGALGCLVQAALVLGDLLTDVVSFYFGYVYLGIMAASLSVLALVIMLKIPESPPYLVRKHAVDDTVASLRFLRGAKYDMTKELEDVKHYVTEPTHYDNLTSARTAKTFLIFLCLLLSRSLCCLDEVVDSTSHLFYPSRIRLRAVALDMFLALVQLVFSCTACFVMDRIGRKTPLVVSAGVIALCALTVTSCVSSNSFVRSDARLACRYVYIVAFSVGLGPVPLMMLGEMFPYSVKTKAVGTLLCTEWLLRFFVSSLVLNWVGDDKLSWFIGFVCTSAIILVFCLVPETRGKTLRETQNLR
ncbi:facilitated trehalose transporter Tret1-like [Periplaneta americana]|uniref:facilitated trehalose transporter Tret1-like n=1 Tax=Periplaneta americana TaxID=6978 RepID=UPI0037E969A0